MECFKKVCFPLSTYKCYKCNGKLLERSENLLHTVTFYFESNVWIKINSFYFFTAFSSMLLCNTFSHLFSERQQARSIKFK